MRNTGFSKSCNPTVRKFYEDFDLLPTEYKELLWDAPYMPTMQDLREVWDMVAEDTKFSDLIKRLNCMNTPEDKKRLAEEKAKDRKRKAEEKRKAKEIDRINKWSKRRNYITMAKTKLIDRTDKHGRLVRLVKEEQAEELLATRKENKDIRPALERVITEIYTVKKKDLGDRECPTKDKTQHIAKSLHNAGGKSSEKTWRK